MGQSSQKINIIEALKSRNLEQISHIVDHCRYNLGLDYMGTYKALNNKLPMTIDEYEQLMYEIDCYETQIGMMN